MHTKTDLMNGISAIGIKPEDTLMVHSSMKSVGEVEGGADTVLDAFIEYMKPGLLIFPTHTWAQINEDHKVFNPLTEPSCVGLLTNLFLKRPNVVRSWHPTHSVAALGKEAAAYTEGEEKWDTPCPRGGCLGKLYDRRAKILFLGCSLKSNTFLHGVEEWNRIPGRLDDKYERLIILKPDGQAIERTDCRHSSPYGDVSVNYDKMEAPFIYAGIARRGLIGDASSVLCDAVGMAELTASFLRRNPELFSDDSPVPAGWYVK